MRPHSAVTLADITAARERIRPYLVPTPLDAAPALGDGIWLKLENLNRTRSFKARGALNALLCLSESERARGVVAASSGNHAQGLALAASLLGVQARIVMPAYAARRKIAGVSRYGADVVLHGATYDEAEAAARRMERDEALTYISAYNDARVIAGAGTIGLEIADALPAVRRVIVPVGGGGLISGIATALKALHPTVEIVGVNAAESPEMYRAFYSLDLPAAPDTLADALAGDIEAGSMTLTITKTLVDRIVLVSEEAIAQAMRWLVYEAGHVGEGGGVVGLAALLSGALEPRAGDVVVISGGNVDSDRLRAILCAG